MDYLRGLLFIILLLGEIIFLVRLLGIPSHLAPLIVILSNSLLLFIFALINLLTIGYYFCLALFIASTLLCIYGLIRPKADTPRFFSGANLPLFVFILVLFSCYFYTRGTLYYSVDEFTHWGVIFKYLTEMRHLPINTEVVAITYPPLTTLWQFFTALLIKVGEDNATFAQMVLEFALVVAIIPAPKQKRELNYVIMFSAVLLSMFFFELRFQRLAIDTMIALLFGVGLAQLPLKGKQSFSQFLALTLVTTSLVLTKPLSPILSVVLIAAIILYTFFTEPGFLKQKPVTANTIRLIVLIMAPLLFWLSWSLHVKDFKSFSEISFTIRSTTPIQSSDKYPMFPNLYLKQLQLKNIDFIKDSLLGKSVKLEVSLEAALKAFTVDTTYFVKTVATNFINTFSDGDGTTSGFTKGRIPQKYYLVLIIVLTIINLYSLGKFDKETQRFHMIYSGALTLGLVLYSVALYFSYIFIFVFEKDFAGVPAFERYFGTYLLPFWLFNILVLYKTANEEEDSRHITFIRWIGLFIIIGSFIFTPTTSIFHLPYSPKAIRFEVQDIYTKISSYSFSSKDKIYEVSVGSAENGLRHNMMRYFLTPTASNYKGWSIRTTRKQDNFEDITFSPEEWLGLLNSQNYTYLLVSNSDAQFWTDYGRLFDTHLTNAEAPQLFRVTSEKLIFVPINDK